MIVFYLMAVCASLVAGGMTWALSLFSAPLWLQLIIFGAVLPMYLGCAVVYLAFLGNICKITFNEGKEGAKDVSKED